MNMKCFSQVGFLCTFHMDEDTHALKHVGHAIGWSQYLAKKHTVAVCPQRQLRSLQAD